MLDFGWSGIAPLPPALAPPREAQASDGEPRSVESNARGEFDTGGSALSFDSTRAVLMLVERSAQNFRKVVELVEDARAAAAMTGATLPNPAADGANVDTYA